MINSGSSAVDDCAELLRQMSDLQRTHAFRLLAHWVPREFNEAADMLSRLCEQQAQEELERVSQPLCPYYSAVMAA